LSSCGGDGGRGVAVTHAALVVDAIDRRRDLVWFALGAPPRGDRKIPRHSFVRRRIVPFAVT
jgi:hypothetical protein